MDDPWELDEKPSALIVWVGAGIVFVALSAIFGLVIGLLLLLSSLAHAADWTIGPSIREDQVYMYRIIEDGQRTAGWAIGWDRAVVFANCQAAVSSLEALMAGNPQLANAALAVRTVDMIHAMRANVGAETSVDGTMIPPAEWITYQYSKWTIKDGVVFKDGLTQGQEAINLVIYGTLYAQRKDGSFVTLSQSGIWEDVQ